MKVEERDPDERCVHCGEKIRAKDYDALYRRYTRHVVEKHDKPAKVPGVMEP